MTEERHELPQLRRQQHEGMEDVYRVRGCAVSSYRRNVHHVAARQRALHMVRRHAWQFHGAGVADAVEKLTGLKEFTGASNAMKDAMTKFAGHVSVAMNVPVELGLSYGDTPRPHPEITDNGTAVVGWRTPHSGLLLCLKHPHREATPVWHAPEGAACAVCGLELMPTVAPSIRPAECDGCGHAHVQGVRCVSGDLYECGCSG